MSTLASQYTERFNVFLKPIAAELEAFLAPIFSDKAFVCRVATRPKAIDSFLDKAERTEDGTPKYTDPLNQIQDQIGALIVTRFPSDFDDVTSLVEQYFRRIEKISIQPDSEYEFGYVGQHYVLFLPSDVSTKYSPQSDIEFFELQIKTLFQYAWSETNHVIGYKRLASLTPDQRRLSAYVAAQAWGADRAVDELYNQVSGVIKQETGDA